MTEDAQLRMWLGAHRSAVSGGSPTDHPDVDTLSRHATAQLSPGKARIVSEHILACEDGRCGAFVRANAEDVDAAAALLYPAGEAEGLHARTFLCREALWEAFQDMARQEGAPVDDLLSEAMRSYARQRSYGGQTVEEQPSQGSNPGAHDYAAHDDDPDLARTGAIRQPTQRMNPPNMPTAEAPAMRRPAAGMPGMPQGGPRPLASVPTSRGVAPPHGGMGGMPAPPPSRQLPPPPPNVQRPFTQPLGHAVPAPPPARSSPRFPSSGGAPLPPPSRGLPSAPRSFPPPLPPSDPQMPAAPQGYGGDMRGDARGGARGRVATQLTLTYQNRSVDVTKERFLLGRSKSQADLVLDDANVSRQHAAIERVGDMWFLADLGSTNGCYVDGQRVSRRQITDGDVIEITTHQIRCTLR